MNVSALEMKHIFLIPLRPAASLSRLLLFREGINALNSRGMPHEDGEEAIKIKIALNDQVPVT